LLWFNWDLVLNQLQYEPAEKAFISLKINLNLQFIKVFSVIMFLKIGKDD